MPGADKKVRASLDAIIAYAGWLEGSSAVMSKCADLVGEWCIPDAEAFGVDLPLVKDGAERMHSAAVAAVMGRKEELADVAGLLHGMSINLAQVAANYANTEMQVVANFGGVNDTHDDVRGALPKAYDYEVQPHR
ncbi:hypothetical protein [Dactylosporangium sp. CA-139066]|uniref:hypothetical protein n=1 Tax=Dactylosporangium sp. CA-139066 TaxID=3239930 RepID=UPI003D8DA258